MIKIVVMPSPEPSRLAWLKQANANLHKYLAELEADQARMVPQRHGMSATEQLTAEVKRRLAELDALIAAADSGDCPDTVRRGEESAIGNHATPRHTKGGPIEVG